MAVNNSFSPCPATYAHSQSYIIATSQVTGTLTNLTVLMPYPNVAWKSVGNAGYLTDANGYDLIFVGSSGVALSFEMVGHGGAATTYSATTGAAEFWVKIPSAATGTQIYSCFGNGSINTYQGSDSGSWDSNYVAVIHHGTASSLLITDSTGINTPSNTGTVTATTGEIGGGASFGTNGQQISLGTNAALNPAAITYYGWVKPLTLPAAANFISITEKSGGSAYSEILIGSAGKIAVYVRGIGTQSPFNCNTGGTNDVHYDGTGSNTLSTGTWYQVAGTYDTAIGVKGYVNGALDGQSLVSGGTLCSNSGATLEGKTGASSGTSVMDEIEISNVARAATWISAEYKNQSAPATFWTVGIVN